MAYRDSTIAHGNGTSPSVAVPAGVAVDDIVILFAQIDSNAADFQTADWPTGFTEFAQSNLNGDGQCSAIGWKRLTGADSGSYTFASLGVTADWSCVAVAFSGRHATNPPVVATTASSNTSNASPVTVTANGVTAVAGDDLLWTSVPDPRATSLTINHTPPASYTEREDGASGWTAISGATRENVSAGATGTVAGSFTLSSSTSGWSSWLVRIPAGVGGSTTHAAAGTVSAISAVAGAVTAILLAAGAVAGVSGTTGDATRVPVIHAAAGTVSASSDTTGTLTARRPVSGAVAGTTATTGTITAKLGAAGIVAGTSDAAGTLTARLVAAGTLSATTGLAGAVTALLPTSGAVNAISATTGSVSVVGGPVTHSVSGTVAATSDTTGSIASARLAVAGVVSISSGTGGTLTARLRVSGAVSTTSTTTGAASLVTGPQIHSVAGSVAALSDASGTITYIAGVAGTTAAVSSTNGSLTIAGELPPDLTVAAPLPPRYTATQPLPATTTAGTPHTPRYTAGGPR